MFSKIIRLINEGFEKSTRKGEIIEKKLAEQDERMKLAKERMEQWDKNTKLIRRK